MHSYQKINHSLGNIILSEAMESITYRSDNDILVIASTFMLIWCNVKKLSADYIILNELDLPELYIIERQKLARDVLKTEQHILWSIASSYLISLVDESCDTQFCKDIRYNNAFESYGEDLRENAEEFAYALEWESSHKLIDVIQKMSWLIEERMVTQDC